MAGVIGLGSALYYMTTRETVRPGSHDMGAPAFLYLVSEQGQVWLKYACALDALSIAQLHNAMGNTKHMKKTLAHIQIEQYLRVSQSKLLQCQVK